MAYCVCYTYVTLHGGGAYPSSSHLFMSCVLMSRFLMSCFLSTRHMLLAPVFRREYTNSMFMFVKSLSYGSIHYSTYPIMPIMSCCTAAARIPPRHIVLCHVFLCHVFLCHVFYRPGIFYWHRFSAESIRIRVCL